MPASPRLALTRAGSRVAARIGTLLTLAASLAAAPLGAQTAAAPGNLCTLGQRLEVVDFGKWHSAVVIGVRVDDYSPCRVHWVGYATTMDGWVPLSYLRATGTGPVQPIPGGANAVDPTLDSIRRGGAPAPMPTRVATGRYRCVAFVNNQLVSSGEFTITGPGTYSAADGAGTYSYDARTGLLRFRGSTWNGQAADYESRPRPALHVHGPSGRRVLDCDGPAR